MLEKYLGQSLRTDQELVICSSDIAQMMPKQRRNEQIRDHIKPKDQ